MGGTACQFLTETLASLPFGLAATGRSSDRVDLLTEGTDPGRPLLLRVDETGKVRFTMLPARTERGERQPEVRHPMLQGEALLFHSEKRPAEPREDGLTVRFLPQHPIQTVPPGLDVLLEPEPFFLPARLLRPNGVETPIQPLHLLSQASLVLGARKHLHLRVTNRLVTPPRGGDASLLLDRQLPAGLPVLLDGAGQLRPVSPPRGPPGPVLSSGGVGRPSRPRR